MLKINEVFLSIQGEGGYTGASAIFVRFSGCNRKCNFCDTEHQEHKKMTARSVFRLITETGDSSNIVVFTGGEPLLQNKEDFAYLINLLKINGYKDIHLETNGTIDSSLLGNFSYVSCSPKDQVLSINPVMVDCWKYLYPNPIVELENVERFPDAEYYIQPTDGIKDSITLCIEKVKQLGRGWKLGVQLHKLINQR